MPEESKSDLVKRIGERIRRIRKEKQLSQEQLAELSGLHTNYIGQVERGEKNVTLETLEKVVVGLGISLEELFRYVSPVEENDTLGQIVELLVDRQVEDQKMALSLLRTVINWGGI